MRLGRLLGVSLVICICNCECTSEGLVWRGFFLNGGGNMGGDGAELGQGCCSEPGGFSDTTYDVSLRPHFVVCFARNGYLAE